MKKRHFLIVFVLISALLLLPACGGLDQSIWTPDPPAALPPPPPPPPPPAQGETVALAFMPGVYTGVGEGGFGGNVYVEVTVNDDGFIESVVVTQHSETQAFMGMVEMNIVAAIIHTQSTDVDVFAGATDSSNALIAAVANALEGAEGEEVILAPEAEEPALAFNPGVFSGVGEGGFGGNVYVDVTVNEFGQIADVTVTSHSETQAFMGMAEMNIVAAIIHTQSTDVDVFAGATDSSNALIAAVEDALAGAAVG